MKLLTQKTRKLTRTGKLGYTVNVPKDFVGKLDFALSCLRSGEVIICPSESCYSISCDAKSRQAVEKIRKIKKDAEFKPITILVSDLEQIEEFGILNEKARKIAEKLMPGRITLVVDKRDESKYNYLSKADQGIAFRIPNNKIMLDLIRSLGSPITTTSANLHSQPSLYKIAEVKDVFKNKVCAIIDAGDLDESTLVSSIYDTRTGEFLRKGAIGKKKIMECFC